MGDVVPFIAKVRSNGDWTVAERARLEELAGRLAADGVRVETVFGATDAGDPWCVVTDENGDVLIHVARIDGKFVVHSAIDDALSEGVDLHTALRERLNSEAEAEDTGVVVPFSLGGRQAQTFLALVIATAFFYETVEFADVAEAAPAPMPETPPADAPPPLPDVKVPTQDRELAVQGAALAEPAAVRPAPLAMAATAERPGSAAPGASEALLRAADAPPLASAPPAPAADTAPPARLEPGLVIAGTSGDDQLTGTAADERLVGGDGDDTLRGGGGNDILEGGAGDDRLELGARVTASGGEGADTFVIVAPQALGDASTLLGVITDFRFGDGDRLVTSTGGTIPLAPRPAPDEQEGGDDDIAQPPTPGPTDAFGPPITGFGPGPADLGTNSTDPNVRRVEVDFDGDGMSDGYVLVWVSGLPVAPNGPAAVGQALGWTDPLA